MEKNEIFVENEGENMDYKKYIAEKLQVEGVSVEEIYESIALPPNTEMGDYALPCFKFAKVLRKSPVMIAEALKAGFTTDDVVSEVSAVNGYLNFKINKSGLVAQTLEKIFAEGDRYGASGEGAGKSICIDYSSINIAKPFHIGHLSTTVLGGALYRIMNFLGYKAIGINHLGDYGTQFGKLISAYKRWGVREEIEKGGIRALNELYVRFHREAEEHPEYEDEARAYFKRIEEKDEECLELFHWFKELTLKDVQKIYELLDIHFDSYNGESFYSDKMPAVVDELKEKQLMTIDDGASIINLEEYNMPPCLILKRDGSTLYPARDIAAALYRKKTYDFEKNIYVTSAGQSLHFAQWFKVVELMGYDWASKLIHVPYGTVSINGAKLATRTGNVILLKDLFAESIEKVAAIMEEKNANLENKEEVAEAVGVGAIIFHYLMNSRIKDINFILEDALNFDGNTGPYAQYTYARTCSIIEKAGGVPAITPDASMITDPSEKALLKTLSVFPEKVLDALNELEPSVITRYILDVCAAFNRFYHECQIVTAPDAKTRDFRIALTACVRSVLGKAFELICMKKTEKI